MEFTFVSPAEECGVILYDEQGRESGRLPFDRENRVGEVNTMPVPSDMEGECTYAFYQGEQLVCDPAGRKYTGNKLYGDPEGNCGKRACLGGAEYDWKDSRCPGIPYRDMFIYCLHVRGFTKHPSSGVKYPGTFAGVTEKIPYLKDLGVTTLEFQPIYEFDEITPDQGLNYWGYKQGYYYAPKNSYAAEDCETECKDMIRTLHESGMEAVLQFYFPDTVNQWQIPEILRFWVKEYRVDGFHIKGQCVPVKLLCTDPYLKGVKLWFETVESAENPGTSKRLGAYLDDFRQVMRRLLKGEEGMIGPAAQQLSEGGRGANKINYFSNYDGFTLMDMVSYERKHNQANGEGGRDGSDYNYTWNCGAEGQTIKKSILRLRKKQIKNALCLLFMGQGTPVIFMGDEFGNSQQGNNNPYCQDNEITWLNWEDLKRNSDLTQFVKRLVELRREKGILHPAGERMPDATACGYPELSYHGEMPWKADLSAGSRLLGIMRTIREKFVYQAVNLHGEVVTMALPRLPGCREWAIRLFTDEDAVLKQELRGQVLELPSRTICLLESIEKEVEK